jgi:Flp pilus assembly protein TadG
VEFALVLPALLLILFAILDYGWFMVNQAALTNAVNAGARAGIKAREWDEENPQEPDVEARRAVKESFWPFQLTDEQIDVDDKVYLTDDGLESADDGRKITGTRMMRVTVTNVAFQPLSGYLPEKLLPARLGAQALMTFP